MLPLVGGGLIARVMLQCFHNSREGQDVPEIEDKVSALAGAELVSTDRLAGQWRWGRRGDTGARHLELLQGIDRLEGKVACVHVQVTT